MPYLREVQAAAREAGALVTVISGAGPSLCAFCGTQAAAEAAARQMKAVYEERSIGATVQVTGVASEGARVLRTDC
jgi:homoserine kinase